MRAQIAILAGDGVGPEVTAEASRVLSKVAQAFGHQFDVTRGVIGGAAIDTMNDPLPEETLAVCEAADAVLLGAVGGPKWADPNAALRPEQGLLRLRRHFDLFANLRPVRLEPALVDQSPLRPGFLEGVDILFVRELAGGIYYGDRREEGVDGLAWDTMAYSRREVARIAEVACAAAESRSGKLVSVDKANVLASMRLWRRVVSEVVAGYPKIEVEHLLVDACAMYLMQLPREFDVILVGNCFGDILSDEAATLAGSLGLLPSASLGSGTFGVYEPIHGSAPDIAGCGKANPIGTILSAAMMLRHSLGLEIEARAVEQAVTRTLAGGARTPDIATPDDAGCSTRELADTVVAEVVSPGSPASR